MNTLLENHIRKFVRVTLIKEEVSQEVKKLSSLLKETEDPNSKNYKNIVGLIHQIYDATKNLQNLTAQYKLLTGQEFSKFHNNIEKEMKASNWKG